MTDQILTNCWGCKKQVSRCSLNGYGICPDCQTAKERAQEARIARDQAPVEISKGDSIEISDMYTGESCSGTVLTARNYGRGDGWYIEFTRTAGGGYGYWKQGSDGGTVKKVVSK